jgi:purine-nucleoside phosphorylase
MEHGFSVRVEAAWESLGPHRGIRPPIGVVLGSGLGAFASGVQGVEIPYSSIAGFPPPSVQGHAGILKLSPRLAVMAGRVHYYEGRPVDDVVLPVFLLHRLGVRILILTNAAGGVNREYKAGDLVLIRDHVNLAGVNPLRGPDPGLGPRFPDMSSAYDPGLRALALSVSETPLAEGVYAGFCGPSYETPAEIRMCAAIGADLVGMSTVPEAIVAAYLGMKVLAVSCVTNMAAGILPQPLSHEEVMETGRAAGPRLVHLLTAVIGRIEEDAAQAGARTGREGGGSAGRGNEG